MAVPDELSAPSIAKVIWLRFFGLRPQNDTFLIRFGR
jgi:hypothetical protein